MKGRWCTALVVAQLFFALSSPAAQNPPADPSETAADSLPVSSRASGDPTVDAAARKPVDETEWPNPTTTMLKSVVVPGWGQITNKRYVKAGIAIGLETWFITGALVSWGKANDALDRFESDPGNIEYFNEYQYYWGQRSDFLWLLGLTVFVSMFDAYVDAHLRPYESDTIPGVDPPKGVKLVIPF